MTLFFRFLGTRMFSDKLEDYKSYLRKVRELPVVVSIIVLDVTEQLKTDTRCDYQQSHSKENERAKLLRWTEDLQIKISGLERVYTNHRVRSFIKLSIGRYKRYKNTKSHNRARYLI